MSEPTEHRPNPRARREKEYEDPHYHDDEGDAVAPEDTPHSPHPPVRRTSTRRPLPRRHYEED